MGALAIASAGCQPDAAPVDRFEDVTAVPALVALGASGDEAILAQGQLEPSNGVISVLAPPGDRLESLEVSAGQKVQAGDTLGRLVSQAAREGELAVAVAQRKEAQATADAEQAVAQAKLEVARTQLEQARLQVQQAKEKFELAQASGGTLDLLDQQVALAESKLAQMRTASNDPAAGRLITSSTLDQQQLAVDQARSDLAAARAEARAASQAGDLAVKAAEQELRAAEVAIESGKAAMPVESLDEQIKLLQLQVDASKLLSPIDGTVVAVHMHPGQPTTGQPILQIADLSDMICRVEVNVSQLSKVKTGARASITSAAIDGSLQGTVRSISRLIGSPQLPSPNPMARVDYRSGEVVIQIEPDDAPRAADLIHLQVDVAIALED
ncbi:multidrug resistance protein MdtN [Roseimaritima ulvae]|uniref:Multidrug resistance protein MdtN n=2 Tax=Roseimaritima ulvae TaxID=980254 RepID=A0A5B9QRN6_9BACT|nr:multidrug resistance protein MdtN [Roseimaritima ulvae]